MYVTIGVLPSSKLDVIVLGALLALTVKYRCQLLDSRPQGGNSAGYYITLKREFGTANFSAEEKEKITAEVYDICGRL